MTPMEAVVRDVAAAVLGTSSDRLDPDRSLFEQGLDSRSAWELASRLGQALGRNLPPTTVLDRPTIRRLAVALDVAPSPAPRPSAGRTSDDDVALVGWAARLPGCDGAEAFADRLARGADAVGMPVEGRGAPVARAAGWLGDLTRFDPDRFGLSDHEAERMSALHRLVLTVAAEAFDHAGLEPLRERTGVWIGLPDGDPSAAVDAWTGTGAESSFASGRVAWALDLGGPAVSLNTACSSSLVALHEAVRAVRAGDVDAALVGGATVLEGGGFRLLDGLRALSADGRCRAFSPDATGFGRAEGAVVLAIARPECARRFGLSARAVVAGTAVRHGGRTPGITVPDADGQLDVVRAAWADAGVTAHDIDVIEAHGTGTPLGDPVELGALRTAFAGANRRPFLTASKTLLGHTEQAAGAVGVLAAALMLRDQRVPALLHGGGADDFVALRQTTRASVQTVAVSAFGLSGVLAHAVLQSPSSGVAPSPENGPSVALVSAATAEGVGPAVEALRAALPHAPWTALAAATRRVRPLRERAAVVASDTAEAEAALLAHRLVAGRSAHRRRVALVFAGAGSTRAGAGQALYDAELPFRADIDRAAHAVSDLGDLRRALFAGEALERPLWTVVGGVSLGWALARRWERLGMRVHAVLGHSFGEIAAAAFVGALDVEDALRVAVVRGRALEALPAGRMAVVWAPGPVVDGLLAPGAWRAGEAAPDEFLVAGPEGAVAATLRAASAAGHRGKSVAASYAAHGPGLDPVRERIADDLAGLVARPPDRRVFTSTGGPSGPDWAMASWWADQLAAPLALHDAVCAAVREGIDVFVECSATAVVLPPAGRARTPPAVLVPSLRRSLPDREAAATAAAELLVVGVDLPALDGPVGPAAAPRAHAVPRHVALARPAAPVPLEVRRALPIYTVRFVEQPSATARPSGHWVLLADRDGVADRLAERLEAAGCAVRVVRGAAAWGPPADHVLDLRPLDPADGPVGWRSRADALRRTASVVSAAGARLWVVTRCATAAEAGDPVDVGGAILWGMTRTLVAEEVALDPVLVDVGPGTPEQAADALWNALAARDDRERQVALRAGRRLVARLVRTAPGAPATLRGDRAYAIFGGTGALGAHLAHALVARGAGLVWRAGRRAPGPDAERQRFVQVDVADPVALEAALHHIDGNGPPLAGVFHLAATLADGRLRSQGTTQVDAVLRPKVDGAWALHRATEHRPLDLFVLFGSAASVLPSPGQALYAGGNAFLDALAAARRAQGLPATTVAWGPWADFGMAHALGPAHRVRQEAQGMRFLRPQDADLALDGVLAAREAAVLVADVDWPTWWSTLPDPPPFTCLLAAKEASAAAPYDGPEPWRGLAALARPAATQRFVEAAVRDVLGRPADLPIDGHVPLTDLGLDSLLAVRLHGRLTEAGFRLAVGRVLSGPSVGQLTDLLCAPVEAEDRALAGDALRTALASALLGAALATSLCALAWSLWAPQEVAAEVIVLPPPP